MSTAHQTFTTVADRSNGNTCTLMLAYAKIAGDLPLSEQDLAVACETPPGRSRADATGNSLLALERDILEMAFDMEG